MASRPPAASLRRLDAALDGIAAPLLAVDLDALDANAAYLTAAADGLPIRLASKSIRCTRIIRHVLDNHAGFAGVLAYTPAEALHLAASGIDDLLVAYPSVDRAALGKIASGEARDAKVRLLVDEPAHVELLAAVAAESGGVFDVCMEIDLGWWPAGGLAKIGPKRSPIREPEQARELTELICRTAGVRLTSVLAYEGHIAGVGDVIPGRPLRQVAVRLMQAASLREISRRLPAVVATIESALSRAGQPPLELVNGGGTGSLSRTASVGVATELAAGSGLYDPLLFDRYRSLDLEPACAFAMPVVRKPMPSMATLLGGGYIASGVPGPDREPSPALPAGLSFDKEEGAGEVQTPLHGRAAADLRVGDTVWLRHAKSGEVFERFTDVHLVRGGAVVETAPTYRGEGQCFL